MYAPGWFSNLEAVWEVPDLGDFLGELASAFRLILLDRRGFGLSDWPITSGALSMELGMDDIRAVMDAAGSERAVLFGFDDGGRDLHRSPRPTQSASRLSFCSRCGPSTTRRLITRGDGRQAKPFGWSNGCRIGRSKSTGRSLGKLEGPQAGILYGVILVLIIFFMPGGIVYGLRQLRSKFVVFVPRLPVPELTSAQRPVAESQPTESTQTV